MQSLDLVIITGPTGVGKTAVAVELAKRLDTEIVSADSMQVYKHLSIGTAKPTSSELQDVCYHLIDYVSPHQQYNLGWFLRDAEPLVADLRARGKLPIVCGGTGLYLRGLLHGVFDGGERDEEIRADLEERAHREGLAPLYEELMRVDPAATHIKPNDRQRVLRALEVFYRTGNPITSLQTQSTDAPRYRATTFILDRPREELYERINARVEAMVAQGLLNEVQQYLDAGYSTDNPAIAALGYAELIAHVRGELALTDALNAMRQKSRNYAKRQLTWFRAMKDSESIGVSGKTADEVADNMSQRSICTTSQLSCKSKHDHIL